MLRKVCWYVVLVCFVISAIPGDVLADRKRLLKPSEKAKAESKPVNISESKHMLTGFLSVGKLTGEITEQISESKDQLFYGFGFGYEYYLQPKIGVGAEIRLHWLSTPEENTNRITNTENRIFAIYRIKPKAEKTVYLKGGVGTSDINNAFWVAKKRTQLRLSVGYLAYSTGKTNTRLELSFSRMLKGSDSDNIDYICFDIGMGLAL